MNDITDKILVNLKIISKIQPCDKVRILNETSTIERDSLTSWLSRWIHGDSRDKTMTHIRTVINDTINITNDIMNSTYINNRSRTTVYEENEFTKSLHMLFLIRNELESSKSGIENLQKTYEMDINVISQLEVIVNKIDSHLNIVDRKLREIHGGPFDRVIFGQKRTDSDSKLTDEPKTTTTTSCVDTTTTSSKSKRT